MMLSSAFRPRTYRVIRRFSEDVNLTYDIRVIVLERDDGMIVGIEIKASATVKSNDFGGLRTLAEACKERFAHGVVLYDSTDLVPFGENLAAAPLSCLWG